MKVATFSFKELAPCFFAILIDILGFGLVYPVLTAMFTNADSHFFPTNLSETARFAYLSLGFLLYPLFMFFGASFMGDLSDVLGRKKVLLICMAGLFISFGLMGLGVNLSSIFLIFLGRSLSGLMGASMPIALAAIADLSTPENKAYHMSFIGLVQSIGFILGPFLGGFLSDRSLFSFFNFSLPFYTASLMALIAFFWIWSSFTETFIKKEHYSIDPKRIFTAFVQAARHPAIRLLAIVFLLMQMGISLYLQLILIEYEELFAYSSFEMGIFNAFMGLWFAIGLLFVVPYVVKKARVEKIVVICLLVTAIALLLSTLFSHQLPLWLIAIPLAVAVQVGYTTILTSFSNAATADTQGWAMGISGSVVAISFVFTGLSPNLVPLIGVRPLIFIGGVFMLLAALLMNVYCKRILPEIK